MITFRPAVREQTQLLIGLIGPSGGGKSYSAFRLAAGISGIRPFVVIDSDARRALHYADMFRFDHGDLTDFSPDSYADAIEAAAKGGYPAIVVDTMSHEWDGPGGYLDLKEAIITRMCKGDPGRRDAMAGAAAGEMKPQHRMMVQRMLQVRTHLIITLRADNGKIDYRKTPDGKTTIVPKTVKMVDGGVTDWIPLCEKGLPYEFTASFLLTPDRPGIPQPIKLQEQHRPLFPLDQPITEVSGQRIAAWASGASVSTGSHARAQETNPGAGDSPGAGSLPPGMTWVDDALAELRTRTGAARDEYWATLKPRFNAAATPDKRRLLDAWGKGKKSHA